MEIKPAISRAEADGRILPYVRLYTEHKFKGITHEAAKVLLGEARFAAMMADRIRSLGPVSGVVYPWNVVDYLSTNDEKIRNG